MPIDTSGLPDAAVITTALLKLNPDPDSKNDFNDGYDYVVIVQATQASTSSLTLEDYDQCGAIDNPTEGSNHVDYGDMTYGSYFTLTLNATGRSWISKTGYTKLGIREGHDIEDTAPPNYDNGNGNKLYVRTSEYSGTASDPKLEITYSIAPPLAAEEFIPPIIIEGD